MCWASQQIYISITFKEIVSAEKEENEQAVQNSCEMAKHASYVLIN